MVNQEEVWFEIQYESKKYIINMYEVVSAIRYAQDHWLIPSLSEEWWNKLLGRYPYLEEDDRTYDEPNAVKLSEDVTYVDDIHFFDACIADKHICYIELHNILEMLYYAEQEDCVPRIDYSSFWYHIKKIYPDYFTQYGYQEVICANSKLKKEDTKEHTR